MTVRESAELPTPTPQESWPVWLAPVVAMTHSLTCVSELGDQGMVWHAQRSSDGALRRAGVHVFCYAAPFILHAKHFESDYRARSTELTLAQWEREPLRRTTLDGLARLTSSLQ